MRWSLSLSLSLSLSIYLSLSLSLSSGILVYEMAYGFTPFKGDTQHATFRFLLSSLPASPHSPSLPPSPPSPLLSLALARSSSLSLDVVEVLSGPVLVRENASEGVEIDGCSSSRRNLLIHIASASVTHLSSSCRRYAMRERKGQAYGTYL
jgi:hypothetical protein